MDTRGLGLPFVKASSKTTALKSLFYVPLSPRPRGLFASLTAFFPHVPLWANSMRLDFDRRRRAKNPPPNGNQLVKIELSASSQSVCLLIKGQGFWARGIYLRKPFTLLPP